MKKSLLVLFSFCIFSNAFAQKTEFRVALNSGLFSFGGGAAADQTSEIQFLSSNNTIQSEGLLNIHGKALNLFNGVSLNVTRVTKKDFIFGLDFGIESLKSNLEINSIIQGQINSPTPATIKNAEGKTILSFRSVNLNPYVGHRFYFKKFSIDATGGVDLAYMYNSHITTDISTGNGITNISVNEYRELLDIRPQIGRASCRERVFKDV